MNAFARLGHLPLLVKELLEQAARPRTYWTRVAYGLLLYLVVMVPQAHFFKGTSGNITSVLGEGRDLFEMLVIFQFIGVFLFLPALMCGRITHEKERDSLVLVLLTELSPAQIVLQKYLAGLIPMLTFLLLGLPLAAVAYAFGGFPPRDLALAAATLLMACLQVGAFAIWCSALCRNTASAFIATYIVGTIFYLGPVCIGGILAQFYSNLLSGPQPLLLHVPPAIFFISHAGDWKDSSFAQGSGIVLTTTLLFLLLATYHLPRRAFAAPAHPLRRLFAWFDLGAQRVNRVFGNIVITRPAASLPGDAPVLWRERRSRLLGRPSYLVRLLLAVEVPVLLLARSIGAPGGGHPYYDSDRIGLSVFAACFGTFSVLAIIVTAANTFAAERANQTLEVLLTTPFAAQDIVRQKARALSGLALVFSVPLLTIFGYEGLLENIGPHARVRTESDPAWVYAGCSLLTVLVYLPLVKWIALWIGLATRSRLRAIVTSLCVVVGWCALPFVIVAGILGVDILGTASWLFFASPLTIPAFSETNSLHEFHVSAWLPVLVNFVLYGIVLHSIRSHCLDEADAYLRR